MAESSLLENRERVKRSRVPAWVVAELVKTGVPEGVAKRMPVRVAFARMRAAQRLAAKKADAQREPDAARVASLLRSLAAEPDPNPSELQDACAEAMSLLQTADMVRVSTGLAALLAEVGRRG